MRRIRFRRARGRLALATAIVALLALQAVAAVPPGYRYIGSRSVTAGRVVLWYWNVDIVEPAGSTVAFAAHLYARAVDVGQERPYVAIVRCDNRSYRPAGESGPFQPIDDGEPIAAVWRAGCANGVVLGAAERRARLDGTAVASERGSVSTVNASGPAPAANASAPAPAAIAAPAPVANASAPTSAANAATPAPAGNTSTPAPATVSQAPASPSAPTSPAPSSADPLRVDACVRMSDVKGAPAGEAAITNTCNHPIEVTLCYRGGGGGPYDCGSTIRGRWSDSLGPGVTHVLPEYRRARHRGIAAVACKGTAGSVFPRLEEPGRSGCG